MAAATYELLNFTPSGPEQAAPLENADRWPCIVGGERSGKSFITGKVLVPHILALPYVKYSKFFTSDGVCRFKPKVDKPRSPHFALFGATYKEPRVEFEYIENDLRALGKLAEGHTSKPSDGPWRMVSTDGVVIVTISLENPESVRAIELEGGAVCEAGVVAYEAIERIRGRVTTTHGFMIFSGTIEASGSWWKDWLLEGRRENNKGIKTYVIPSWTNKLMFPGGEADPEIVSWRSFLGEDLFLERCAAVPRPPRFRVVKEAKEEHIKRVECPEDADTLVCIDPGYATAHAILFVKLWTEGDKKRVHVYDELYEQGKNTEEMIGLCRKVRDWGLIKRGAIDIAAKGHRDATNSALEIWQKLCPGLDLYHKYWLQDRGIERLQNSFHNNQITIDPKCAGLIAELGLGEPVFPEMHPWRYASDKSGRIISENPEDKWNHSVKALYYLLLRELGQVEVKRKATSWNRLKRH